MKPRYLSALALAVAPTSAAAHSFESGADLYAQFVEGAGVVVTYPAVFLPLLALGLFLSLWHAEGMVRAWPVFLLGQLAGIAVAPLVGEWILPLMMGTGLIVGALAALLPHPGRIAALFFAGLLGILALALGLEGHALFELPVLIHLGLIFGTNATVALAAGIARLAMDRVPADWMRITLRVAASWIAAMLMLILAFTVRTGPGGGGL
ncbi:hypothetical protein [Gymnodinialimonas ulvae]|uniref:hypothetical protein n=1 Tax=Gymnodinialimonas ulvae TaxID=3126504 RepID=UPI0030A32DAC